MTPEAWMRTLSHETLVFTNGLVCSFDRYGDTLVGVHRYIEEDQVAPAVTRLVELGAAINAEILVPAAPQNP